jgi:hypothetical protein
MRKILVPRRNDMISDQLVQRSFYNVIYREEPDEVQKHIDYGLDPNYCYGECGWVDSNPLDIVAYGHYSTYYIHLFGDEIPDPIPDVATLQVLITGGADINRRPYIWERVYRFSNKGLKRRWQSDSIACTPGVVEKELKAYYIKDANRILEAFLKAGADPDKLGHAYPYSSEAMKARIADEQAKEYFAKGTRAINEAIEKGIAWESQVDLLLKYTNLDEESLKAAKRSNDPAMVKKIQKLWKAQRK